MTNQVSTLVDLKEFTDNPANNKHNVKFKSLQDRRKYVKETLKLSIVKDPKTGKDAVPIYDRTLMMSGVRMSAARVKEEMHQDKHEAKKAFSAARESVQVGTNTKARLKNIHRSLKLWLADSLIEFSRIVNCYLSGGIGGT